jgi:anti-anti-sigma factor
MKPENPAAIPDAAIARVLSATEHSNEKRNEKKNDKRLKLTLEGGHSGSAVVLHCQGRIIFRNEARALSTIVAEVLPSARRMVVDLAGIDSVDSGGLGELVLTHMWAEAAGYTLKFASPKISVRHLFEITNLVSVFDIYASVPEAMAAMVQEEVQSA